LDSRQLTPQLVTKITIAGVKDRSEVEAAKTLKDIGGVQVSGKTVERVLHDVGEEITQLRDGPPSRLSRTLVPKPPADAPQSVMVSADGGRMLTRESGQGPGVHNHRWRETVTGRIAVALFAELWLYRFWGVKWWVGRIVENFGEGVCGGADLRGQKRPP